MQIEVEALEGEQSRFLIGDINAEGGVCDDCSGVYAHTKVLAYRDLGPLLAERGERVGSDFRDHLIEVSEGERSRSEEELNRLLQALDAVAGAMARGDRAALAVVHPSVQPLVDAVKSRMAKLEEVAERDNAMRSSAHTPVEPEPNALTPVVTLLPIRLRERACMTLPDGTKRGGADLFIIPFDGEYDGVEFFGGVTTSACIELHVKGAKVPSDGYQDRVAVLVDPRDLVQDVVAWCRAQGRL